MDLSDYTTEWLGCLEKTAADFPAFVAFSRPDILTEIDRRKPLIELAEKYCRDAEAADMAGPATDSLGRRYDPAFAQKLYRSLRIKAEELGFASDEFHREVVRLNRNKRKP